MKKIFTTVLAFLAVKSAIVAQTVTAVGIVTLTGAPGTPMEVAFNPTANLYYASSGGGGCNNLVTYSLTGGAPFSTVSECYDARGLWWNGLTNVLEGNSYNSAGIYTMVLSGGGVPSGVGAIAAANSQPNAQTGGQFDPTTNQVLYYNGAMGIAKYNRVAPGALINTVAITGLPGGIGSICTYGFYTGIPGREYAIYDYTNRRAYLINYTTGAYVSTVQFPPTAGNQSFYNLSYANGMYFICDGIGTWIGYRACAAILSNPANGMLCSGSNVSLTAVGATSYTWSTGALTSSIIASPSITTTYSIVSSPTLAGCPSNTAALTITVNTSPTVAVSGNTLICGTGTNVLTASGAGTYSWSNGAATASISASPTISTTYTVVGTASVGGCTNAQTISIMVSSNPTVAVVGPTAAVCAGSAFSLTASGASTYSWSNGAMTSTIAPTPTANAGYTVIGTNTAGCTNSAVANVTVTSAPSVSVTGAGTICVGNSTVLTASGANTYSWNTGATTSTISVSPTVNTTYTAMGTSTVTGCTGMVTANIVVSPCTGLQTSNFKSETLRVYPNPTSGELTIELNNGSSKTVEICDLTGRVILSNTYSKDNVDINISHLANGIYYVKVQSSNAVEVMKIVKQ